MHTHIYLVSVLFIALKSHLQFSFDAIHIYQTRQTFIYLNSTLARNNLIENHLLRDVHLGMLKCDGYHQILVVPIGLSNC